MSMYYVVENPGLAHVRVIDHTPRGNEIVIAECKDHRDAFAELRVHEARLDYRRSIRQAWLAVALMALFVFGAAIVPDLDPPAAEVQR